MFTHRNLFISSVLASCFITGAAHAEDLLLAPNRFVSVQSHAPAGADLDLEVIWSASIAEPTSTTMDLSTEIFVQVGDYTAIQTVRVLADPGAGYCPGVPFGGSCGTGSIDDVPVELVSMSEDGTTTQFPWIKTSFPIPAGMFDDTDIVHVRLLPSPGAEPEVDTSDDTAVEPVGDAFHDRSFRSVELVPVPGAHDMYDIVVEYQLAYNTAVPPQDLRTDIVMHHAGETHVFQPWCGPWLTTSVASCGDCFSQTCATITCNGSIVTTLSCQPYENAWGQYGCVCASQPILVTIPSVHLKAGDGLELTLTHAPGAMPEADGLDLDTWTVCSTEATSATYGQGKAGTLGVPVLDSVAPPILGQLSGIAMKEALPGAMPVLFLGLNPMDVPFAGGRLLVDPAQVLFLPMPVAADGTIALQALLPADTSLCGTSLYYQMMFLDSGAAGPKPIAMTNGLNQIFGW